MAKTRNIKFMMTGSTYDFTKKLAQVYIPAVASLYFGLAAIWGLPAGEQVVGSLALFDTFLGVCLGISSSNFEASGAAYDGQLVVTPNEEGPTVFGLELDSDPEELNEKDSIRFKVVKTSPTPKKATRARKRT